MISKTIRRTSLFIIPLLILQLFSLECLAEVAVPAGVSSQEGVGQKVATVKSDSFYIGLSVSHPLNVGLDLEYFNSLNTSMIFNAYRPTTDFVFEFQYLFHDSNGLNKIPYLYKGIGIGNSTTNNVYVAIPFGFAIGRVIYVELSPMLEKDRLPLMLKGGIRGSLEGFLRELEKATLWKFPPGIPPVFQ